MKYYRTTISIDVLSEGGPVGESWDLDAIAYAIDKGDCVGGMVNRAVKELTPKEAAAALTELGSDPSFFMLNAEGNKLY